MTTSLEPDSPRPAEVGTREYALPGDPDLDLDLSDVVLTSVVREGSEFIVVGGGGSGRWMSAETGRMEDISTVTDLDMGFGMEMEPGWEHLLDGIAARLERWVNERTPLRVVAAPGRWMTLIESTKCWVPIPRREPHFDGDET